MVLFYKNKFFVLDLIKVLFLVLVILKNNCYYIIRKLFVCICKNINVLCYKFKEMFYLNIVYVLFIYYLCVWFRIFFFKW